MNGIDNQFLKEIFHTQNDALVEAVASKMNILTAKRKDVLIRQGEDDKLLYFQVDGVCLGIFHAENGKTVPECITQPKDVYYLGLSLEEKTTAICDLIAGSNVVIYTVPKTEAIKMIARFPELTVIYIKTLLGNANKHRKFQLAMSSMNAQERVEWLEKEYPYAVSMLSQRDMAAICGMTPEHYSRAKKKLHDSE